MRKAVAYLSFILFGLALSFVVAVYGWYELEMAKAQESFLAFDFDGAEQRLNGVQKYIDHARKIPILGNWVIGTDSEKAGIDYWQKEYGAVVNLNLNQETSDSDIDFIKANSVYRQIEFQKDRAKVLEGLDVAISGYAQTVNKDEQNLNAVFNYEFLLRTRNNVANKKMPLPLNGSGKMPALNGQGVHGQEGQQMGSGSENSIKIHVPIGNDEGENGRGGNDAGKGDVQRKKG